MTNHEIEQQIIAAGMRPSPVKSLVIRTLTGAKGPLSSLEIENCLVSVNRSSISRTLALFAAKGIVHTVEDGSGSTKYEICHSCGRHEHHDDTHPHFHCLRCGHTFCLEGMAMPHCELPQGFKAVSMNFVIKGLCPDCSTEN